MLIGRIIVALQWYCIYFWSFN